ncbi:hypothetical protein [Candidatus Kryptobacter tengchongensis]|uniref:hypothetical protein n=1 Tax=Kryptobacter tengchongensis TaxID=1643429 RepID=UPI0007084744|nr:hypothetical protein [Candidatus Kryptobacter tengchongensis]CUS78142.1 hypothetical protein JGI20_00491 [Candidatus Kryptobacter tengchongensis]
MVKDFGEDKVIHLMKGKRRYITILPYEEFKRMKDKVKSFEKIIDKQLEKRDGFDLRFTENLLVEILDLFKGNLEEVYKFIEKLEDLKLRPIPVESKKIGSSIYEILLNNVVLTYRVNKQKKLLTVLKVERGT